MSVENVQLGESEVTFVDGQASEQEDTGLSTGEGARDAEREAAKAAVAKAWKSEGKSEPESRMKEKVSEEEEVPADTEDGEKPAKAVKEEPVEDEDAITLRKALNNREKLVKAKAAQAEQARQTQEQLQRQWYQIKQREAELERQAQQFEQFKKDPVKAFHALYGQGREEEFILGLAQQNTPEGRQAAMLRQMQEQIEEQKNWQQNVLRQQQEAMERQRQAQEVQYRQSVEERFMKHAFDEAKHPHLATMYAGMERAAIAHGDLVAIQFRELTGKEAEPEDIAEYLEEELAKKAAALYKKVNPNKVNNTLEAPQVVASKPVGKGKTLTPSAVSQRNGGQRSVESLDGDERLEAAKQAVKAAFAAEAAKQRG
mgnify:CR=1 FL=1